MSKISSSRLIKRGRSKLVTPQLIDKRIAAGDGCGVREEYVPWIKVRSIPSRGTSHIVPGVKIGRTHHLLSNAEYHYFLVLEHDPLIIDIREQFPLHPAAETHAIASSLKISPPCYPHTDTPLVLTTDFLITVLDANGGERLIARSLKYLSEFEQASKAELNRILEKLDLERMYWERRGVEWRLTLYENLSKTRIDNLLVLRSYANITPEIASEKNIKQMLEVIALAKFDQVPVREFIKKIAKVIYMQYRDAKKLFFHLVWNRRIEVDLNSNVICLDQPLPVKVSSISSSSSSEVAKNA
ncbi:TnsA endonuclease N-terminal domain-containing protein [Pseudomonas paralcaligenes]|uniref:TnsA endonuclease N-terminal domain-containing protein n=1 Tax=Pseudomonas paralcaligenes TaxID=2772558 RepID=UPI001C7F19DB|nr:TnsA endonuclease N-terminal domain-containing protein [Pseudomonas paralcaligenes]